MVIAKGVKRHPLFLFISIRVGKRQQKGGKLHLFKQVVISQNVYFTKRYDVCRGGLESHFSTIINIFYVESEKNMRKTWK